MSYTPYQIPRFGGLDVREPEEAAAGSALDMMNLDLDLPGAVRVRDGTTAFNATPSASNLKFARVWRGGSAGAPIVIAADAADDLRAYNTAGTSLATLATTHRYVSLASLGTAAAGPYAYIGGTESGQIKRFDGAAFTSPAGMPNARYVEVQPTENRLVAAYTDATNKKSRVEFSDAGLPETWTSTSWVDLFPNDGETITGMCAWGNQLFVFKPSRFFVFYGNSTASDGTPVFNYRTVDMGVGVSTRDGAVAAADGVYFMHRSGFYRTTGGAPQKITQTIEPLFSGPPARSFRFFLGTNALNVSLTASDNPSRPIVVGPRILFPLPNNASSAVTDGGGTTLVYYPATQDWSVWSADISLDAKPWYPQAVIETSGLTDSTVLLWADTSGANAQLYRSLSTATLDATAGISSRYRSGFYSPIGSPSQECSLRESIIDGIGTPSFSVSRDFGAVPTSGGGAKTAVTLGTSPAYAQGRHRVSQRGRRFSWQAEATSGVWRINSITQHITGIRSPGLKTT